MRSLTALQALGYPGSAGLYAVDVRKQRAPKISARRGATGENADECGIIVAGLCKDRHAYAVASLFHAKRLC